MIFPVPVLLQESVQEIVPYTISGHVMETLNYPDKYRCQARVGNLTYPLHVLCKYWCRKCSFSSSGSTIRTMIISHGFWQSYVNVVQTENYLTWLYRFSS